MAKFKVMVTDKLSEKGVKVFQADKDIQCDVLPTPSPEDLLKIIPQYHALVIRSATTVSAAVLDAATNLKVVGRAGVGLDNVDIPEATRHGVIVMNTPDGNTISAAEHTLSIMLALARKIPQAHQSLKEKKWDRNKFMGVEMYGKTLGVIGLGRIGWEVAKRARAFEMRILAYDPYATPEKALSVGAELTSIDEILKQADFITVHVPKTKETTNLINAESLKKCKKGVRLINVARGGIYNEADVAEALKTGQVGGAAIDVFSEEPPTGSPLLDAENVVLTPHLGASTEEAQVNVAEVVAMQIVDALHGRTIANAVNIPAISLEDWKVMEPYYHMARNLGRFAAQFFGGTIKGIEVTFGGEVAKKKPDALMRVLLKELLSPYFDKAVNEVNVQVLAAEKGIKISESRVEAGDFTRSLGLKVILESGTHSLEAAATGNSTLITDLDGFRVSIPTEGALIIFFNKDLPGMIGKAAMALGEAGVNIASLTNGRKEKGGEAVTVVNVDSAVAPSVVEKLNAIPGVRNARVIQL